MAFSLFITYMSVCVCICVHDLKAFEFDDDILPCYPSSVLTTAAKLF